jgi:hypothetical protein
VDTVSLLGITIELIHTPVCEPVHPAWISALTTPIATSTAVLQLTDGRYLRIAPCEVELDPGKYPSLGLEISPCDESALRWRGAGGQIYSMSPLGAASTVLPLIVASCTPSDPLGEGTTSEVVLSGTRGNSLMFRHIFPPMTLGLAFSTT